MERRDIRARKARRETLVFQVDGVIARIERELGEFEKVASYDASLRLRQAQAFMELERWREAGMILDAAVEGLEADGVVEQAALTLSSGCFINSIGPRICTLPLFT
jgi:hypothetical protein